MYDSADQNSIVEHAKRSRSNSRIKAATALLPSLNDKNGNKISGELDDFDTDPYLLNVLNGTIDLRTGKLQACQATIIPVP